MQLMILLYAVLSLLTGCLTMALGFMIFPSAAGFWLARCYVGYYCEMKNYQLANPESSASDAADGQ